MWSKIAVIYNKSFSQDHEYGCWNNTEIMPLWLYTSKPCPCVSHLEALESGPRKYEWRNDECQGYQCCPVICMSFKKIADSSSLIPEKMHGLKDAMTGIHKSECSSDELLLYLLKLVICKFTKLQRREENCSLCHNFPEFSCFLGMWKMVWDCWAATNIGNVYNGKW